MKILTILLAAALLVASLAYAEKPDAVDNPPIRIREQNLDENGDIAVHEQGVVAVEDVNETGKQLVSWDCGNGRNAPSIISACLNPGQFWEVPAPAPGVTRTYQACLAPASYSTTYR